MMLVSYPVGLNDAQAGKHTIGNSRVGGNLISGPAVEASA
jgi:hypothetical protein